MKNKNMFKIILDLIMAVILVMLYNKQVINLAFHEIAGLTLMAVFIIHIVLNYKWVISVSKNLFSQKTSSKAKLMYIVDVLLLAAFVIILISGVLISKIIFKINTGGMVFKTVHYFCSAIALILIGIHLALHRHFIFNMFGKIVSVPKKITFTFGIVFASIIFVFGCYSIVTTNFMRYITMPFTYSTNAGQHNMMPHGELNQQENRQSSNSKAQHDFDDKKEHNGQQHDNIDQKHRSRIDEQGIQNGENIRPNNQQNRNRFSKKSFSILYLLKVIANYFSIIFVFAVLTSLIEMLFKKRKHKSDVINIEQ